MAFTMLMDARLMSSKFRTVDRHTLYLLPPSVQDWLPEDHLARFVVDIVERLDLSALERQYSGGGKDPYHPSLLLGLLFYGYATGVFSSRKLERATYDSVAFRYIAANSHPDHDTIASFRKRFLKELQGLFVQILLIAQETGLLKLGNVSLDGTKVQANASKHKALSWAYAKRLEEQLRAEVSALLEQAVEAKSLGHTLAVLKNLETRCKLKLREVTHFIEQRQIGVRLNITGDAGIAIPVPRAANITAFFAEPHVSEASVSQAIPEQQTSKARADNHNLAFIIE